MQLQQIQEEWEGPRALQVKQNKTSSLSSFAFYLFIYLFETGGVKDTDVFEDGKRKLKNTHLRTSVSLGMQEFQDGSLDSDSLICMLYIFSPFI